MKPALDDKFDEFMKKNLIFYLLFLPAFFLQGQNSRTIQIDTTNARPLNLSQIAEKVTPVVLESPLRIQDICIANEFIFITSTSTVVQFDMSGKLIKSIDCGGMLVSNIITADTVKRELYVGVGNTIKRYNYAENLIKEYSLNATNSNACLFHNDALWVISSVFQPDHSAIYTIHKINPSTNQLTTLPFEKKIPPFQIPSGGSVSMPVFSLLTVYNEDLVASFTPDLVLYGIQQDKVSPLVQWNINPPAKDPSEQLSLKANGFTSEYLLINYSRDRKNYVFLENMQTGAKYTTNNIIDDVFHSNGDCNIKFVEKNGYFAFNKEKDAITGNNVGGIPLKNGPVVFIVKTQ